ncbi:MAG TPA: glycosyltransferase [Pyrinomonadaceae bacterium]|jgi:glycosyltransferase involved in cell wall biosynthesis|nr:glycosyltransferase [Pyrinomonadaceae bacterium]
MRIIRIIARLNVGGPARHVSWLTAATRRAGHDSVLVAGTVPAGEDDMSYFAASQGVEPLIIPEMSREISLKDALTVWKLYRLFVRLKPDIVHTHTAKAGTVGRVAGMLYRWLTPATLKGRPRACRFVHTYHGHVFHSYYGKWKTRFFLLIERTLARLATDRIIVISARQFEEIHKDFGVGRAEQFAVIPLGLDTQVFADWRARRAAARAEFGATDATRGIKIEAAATTSRAQEPTTDVRAGAQEATPETVLVGIVGRLTEIKNHRLFLDMAARYKATDGAKDAGRRAHFLVIGDGHLRGELEAYAREIGLTANDVFFTGMRRDAENFYPALDVVALTSLNEGTPLTLIEAMANSRAVLSTAVGGVADLLGKEIEGTQRSEGAGSYTICERGVRVASGDAEGLTEGLARLVADESLRRGLGERGQAFVERNYSVARLVADVSKLYAELHAPEEILKGEKGKWTKGTGERTSAL